MHNKLISAVIILALCFACGCQSKPTQTTEPASREPATQTEQKPAAESSQPTTAQKATDTQPGASAPSEVGKGKAAAKSAASAQGGTEGQASTSSKPSSAAPKASPKSEKAPAQSIVLTGAPMGGVRFDHGKHQVACETCHHAPRDPKRGSTEMAACTSCHTKPPQPGMNTGKQAAFHNASATAGTCIDCHKKSGAAAPTKCAQCHKKENA